MSPPLLEAWIEMLLIMSFNSSMEVASFVGGVD